VGGDLVDYVALDGFRHAVVLADVSGKGLGAALLSAKLQATLRALLPIAASLDDLGAQVNRILHRDGLDNRYATLFVAELEHHSAQVRYLNAGHNPPMLLRAGGLDTLGASAQPVGMLESVSYQESALELAPGDAIIAYSDGLTEAINAAGEEFGAERLRAVLAELRGRPPAVVGARILAAVETFQGEVRPADDLSLAIIVRD
jgi:sigma-B regulation protein RsbU (phosphoserine phosphatase)